MLRALARAAQSAALLPAAASGMGGAAAEALAPTAAAAAVCGGRAAWLRLPAARRAFSAAAEESGESISVTFKDEKDGSEKTVKAPLGKSILEIAHENDVELEGACEGSLACSTCHVIVEDQEYYDKLPEPDDDENDMLDLAFGLTDTSRLGCQVKCHRYMDGIVLRIPSASNNQQ
ncbi:adrenodoxin mitochondrial isoform X3 isoform B [Chlorella sorokiniana]|jgi:ferredoxin|uniref:2Fe-2S ferredoxin n=1 Tax=Chlorella sorokiniana TaxID=3076 RepID=A0A2P6TCC1_CHLSO|nr:adrenodoxin mitochondrial isoform X3 isoform B [Chlorella sorokiniana]|eukprot:PRW20283.1 adrenodoxin mitochondrial isoform X3 isoform B [Chlorella sorokiniana]